MGFTDKLDDKEIVEEPKSEFNKEFKRTAKKATKLGLVALLSAATLFGTFYSVDDKKLKEQDKREIVTLAYNQKGSSAGILAGLFNVVDGNVYGVSTGLSSAIRGDSYGGAFSLLNVINGKVTGVELGFANIFDGRDKSFKEKVVDKGLEIGIFNIAYKIKHTIQLGLVNVVEKEAEGPFLQLGLYNQTNKKSTIGINFGYKK